MCSWRLCVRLTCLASRTANSWLMGCRRASRDSISYLALRWCILSKVEATRAHDDQAPDGIGGLSIDELATIRVDDSSSQPLSIQQVAERDQTHRASSSTGSQLKSGSVGSVCCV